MREESADIVVAMLIAWYTLKQINCSESAKSFDDEAEEHKYKEDLSMKQISTDKAPAAIGPYSQGFVSGNILFSAGQIALDPATGEIVGEDISAQTEQVMKNLGAILEAAGSSYEKTLKTTCFLSDMGDFAAFNEVYGKYFTGKPARSCVAVKTLPKNVLVEVEVIAEVE